MGNIVVVHLNLHVTRGSEPNFLTEQLEVAAFWRKQLSDGLKFTVVSFHLESQEKYTHVLELIYSVTANERI